MSRPLRWFDAITINIYFTGLTTVSQTLTPLVIPLVVQQFVGVDQQGGYYGQIRLWSLMTALVFQSFMGLLSDRSRSRWGRRRPFIFVGTLFDLLFITLIGVSAGMEGLAGFWFLFAMVLLLQISLNTAHAAAQPLIPDLVPNEKRGLYSGIKALFEVPIPLILVAFTIGRMIATGRYWAGLITAMVILVATMILTMFVPEKSNSDPVEKMDWNPLIRLAAMTVVFTLIILGMGKLSLEFTDFFAKHLPEWGTLLAIGIVGLVAMLLAVGVGVWVSIRISLGEEAKSNPSYTWWVINRLAFLVGITNIASFAVFFLQGRLNLEREQAAGPASQLIMVVGIFILLLALPSGWLADRFGRKLLVIISGFCGAFGALILIIAPNLVWIYIGAIIVGAAAGTFYTTNWALGTTLVPKSEAGRYLGISNLAGAGAGAVGAYIGGPIADYVTHYLPGKPGLGYVLLFTIYGILLLLSAIIAFKIKANHNP